MSSFEVEEASERLSVVSQGRRSSASKALGSAKETDLIMNLVTGGLGTGILCLPWLIAGASLLPGLAIVLGVLLLNAWTIEILVEASHRRQVFDLGTLLGQLPGRLGVTMQLLSNVTVWLSIFICLVSYMIVVVEAVQDLGPAQLPRWVAAVGAAALACPLCFLDQAKLAFTSLFTVVVFVYIFLVILAKLLEKGVHDDLCLFGFGIGNIAMFGGMSNCVIVQMCILPMYGELIDRTPAKMNRAVRVSFSCLFVLFTSFSIGGYLLCGSGVEDNILKRIKGGFFESMAQFGAAAAVLGVYPIMVAPMVAPVLASPQLAPAATPVTLSIVAASGFFAIFFSSLGTLNVVNGAICTGIFVGVLPALVGYYLLGKPMRQMAALMIAELVAALLGLVYTDNYVDQLQCWTS